VEKHVDCCTIIAHWTPWHRHWIHWLRFSVILFSPSKIFQG
jgi:hypothetical protein